ncbi:response regulator [Waterburya agarophytonicola K14]|uniref:Response regulator n=1 Tax=Waterburya agarophytonicola KI4 TaxID=2874699 RepID=A0A964FDS2_9CYAN|nr:response regulator [Waterburya agarophytonicola]MCC0175376.1 response regulator [Waterburya agarophytonicola KI4]
MINILIVDDQKSVRARLEYLVQSVTDFNVIGIAENGSDAIAQVQVLQPDIVLLDMELPEISGLMVTKLISKDFPNIKILVLSSHDKQEYVSQSMSAGATGYLLKGSPDEEIEQAIRFVSKGCTHFGAGLFAKMLPIVEDHSSSLDLVIEEELTLDSSFLAIPSTVEKTPTKTTSQKKQILAWLIVTISLTAGIYTFRQWLRQPLPALSHTQQSDNIATTEFSGKLVPAKTFKIGAIDLGIIDNVYVQVGDKVEIGQPLLTLKNLSAEAQKKQIIQEQQLTKQQQQTVLQQQQTAQQRLLELDRQIDRLKYNLAPLKAKIAQANLQVSLAKSDADKLPLRQRQDSVPRTKAVYQRSQAHFNRLSDLYQQGAISLEKLEQAQSELEIAKLDYDMAIAAAAANAELAQNQRTLSQLQEKLALQEQEDAIASLEKQKQTARLEYQQAESKLALLRQQATQLNKYQVPEIHKVIKATEAGIVAKLPVTEGEQIYSGNTVVELAKLEQLKITIPVNARLINALSLEQAAIIKLGSGVTAQKFEGKITTVNPLPTEKLNYLVEVEFTNSTDELLVGQLARVQFMPQTIAGGK